MTGQLLPDLKSIFPEVVQSFEDIAVQHNYEILLSSTIHDPQRTELAVRRMVERRATLGHN